MLLDPFLVHSLGFGSLVRSQRGDSSAGRAAGPSPPGPPVRAGAAGGDRRGADRGGPDRPPGLREPAAGCLPANLVAAPAAAALSLWGLASGLIGGVIGLVAGSSDRGPAAVLQLPTAGLAGLIREVAQVAARSPVMIGPRRRRPLRRRPGGVDGPAPVRCRTGPAPGRWWRAQRRDSFRGRADGRGPAGPGRPAAGRRRSRRT